MELSNFIELAVESNTACYIWDNEKEENVYEGTLEDIPEDVKDTAYLTSWEISDNGVIGFNVDFA